MTTRSPLRCSHTVPARHVGTTPPVRRVILEQLKGGPVAARALVDFVCLTACTDPLAARAAIAELVEQGEVRSVDTVVPSTIGGRPCVRRDELLSLRGGDLA